VLSSGSRPYVSSTDLGVDSHVFEEAGDAPKPLIKVMAFFQGMRDRLKNLLILFGMSLVNLLYSADIVLQVSNSMFPCLQSLRQQAGGLIARTSSQSRDNGRMEVCVRLTVLGSISGTASSPKVVPCLKGIVFESPLIVACLSRGLYDRLR
jgi:hypothetical protein